MTSTSPPGPAPRYVKDSYLTTLVFRLGGVDTDAAERFEQANPKEARAINRTIKRLLGGAWELWWLKTPMPGVVWCNAPHMSGYDGTDPASLTQAEFAARDKITEAATYVRATCPASRTATCVDVAEQMGVRQTRLLEGEYVVTKDDMPSRRHFADTVARGRDYYTPYRSLLPRDVDQLLVAGRHYSATPEAQRISREIPPCMAQGQAAGIAAALAGRRTRGRPGDRRDARGATPRDIQRDADPGEPTRPTPRQANATIDEEDVA